MSIDWNTAPEGATHYAPKLEENDFWCSVFWRMENGVGVEAWQIDNKTGELNHLRWPVWHERNTPRLVPRPAASAPAAPNWDGQGLPPVGIQIEAKFPVTDVTGTHYHWRRVIVAVAGIPRAERECLVYDAEDTKPAWVDEFRPLRTPEQVAAAERWAAIQQMLAFADVKYGAGELMSPKEYVETAVAALYDAGYRRQESST
ncbi:hypothetical protein I5L78_23760 [Pseudomonas aeruginosa]|nr:hypothetical protein [Pseudomonas aeruginosa]